MLKNSLCVFISRKHLDLFVETFTKNLNEIEKEALLKEKVARVYIYFKKDLASNLQNLVELKFIFIRI